MQKKSKEATTRTRRIAGFQPTAGREKECPGKPTISPSEASLCQAGIPDPELPKPTRRQFTASYKLRILKEVEDAAEGNIGEILRREGLYSSYLATWKKQRERGELEGLKAKKRGPQARMSTSVRQHVAQVEKENRRLVHRLDQAEKIIEIQKKISELLGIPLSKTERDEKT